MYRKRAMREAEAAGQVADSLEVRAALIARMDAGELTLGQVQAELKRIKRNAKKDGKVTRAAILSGRTRAGGSDD
jgi:hypothetical protein